MIKLDRTSLLRSFLVRAILIYSFVLLVLTGSSLFMNQVLKEQAAAQAKSLIKRMVSRGDYRETILTLSNAKLEYFESVTFYHSDGSKLFTIPSQVFKNENDPKSFLEYLTTSEIQLPLLYEDSESEFGHLIFVFNRWALLPYAILIWLFFGLAAIPLMLNLRKRTLESAYREMKIQADLEKVELAKKVRHDIKAPLMVLSGLIDSLTEIKETDKKILFSSVERINSIIKDLDYGKDKAQIKSGNLVSPAITQTSIRILIDEIISEKKINFKNIEFVFNARIETMYCFTSISKDDLQRTISNLVDNAVESLSGPGKVEVNLELRDSENIISIKDSGKGILPEQIPLITQKGVSFGKVVGTGLGLYYAKKLAENNSGSLSISSKVGIGTEVVFVVPVANQPRWVPSQIPLTKFKKIAIIDDQELNHVTIKFILNDKLKNIELLSFNSCEEFIASQKTNYQKFDWYFIDFDFGKNRMNGFDFITQNSLQSCSLLVTGHIDLFSKNHPIYSSGIQMAAKSLDGVPFI